MIQHLEAADVPGRRTALQVIGVGFAALIVSAACASGSVDPPPSVAEETRSATETPTEPPVERSATAERDTDEVPAAGEETAAATVDFDVESFATIKPGGPREVDPRRYRQLLGRDQIVPIYEPLIVSPEKAEITEDELVMGVAINGQARAYPIGMMRSREIANDELGGVPILVTW